MGSVLGRALLGGLLLLPFASHAQIYTCRGADGSRVFSDEKCGPDAAPVKGFENTKKAKPKSKSSAVTGNTKSTDAKAKGGAKPAPPAPLKSAEELAQLLKQCDAGDTQACTTWTLGGGPNALREAEHKAEVACEGGSLQDCEERYCKEGATELCRQSVLRTAELSGDHWYLRSVGARAADGSQTYGLRCIHQNVKETFDVAVVCSANPRRRCSQAQSKDTFDGVRAAAASLCAGRK